MKLFKNLIFLITIISICDSYIINNTFNAFSVENNYFFCLNNTISLYPVIVLEEELDIFFRLYDHNCFEILLESINSTTTFNSLYKLTIETNNLTKIHANNYFDTAKKCNISIYIAINNYEFRTTSDDSNVDCNVNYYYINPFKELNSQLLFFNDVDNYEFLEYTSIIVNNSKSVVANFIIEYYTITLTTLIVYDKMPNIPAIKFNSIDNINQLEYLENNKTIDTQISSNMTLDKELIVIAHINPYDFKTEFDDYDEYENNITECFNDPDINTIVSCLYDENVLFLHDLIFIEDINKQIANNQRKKRFVAAATAFFGVFTNKKKKPKKVKKDREKSYKQKQDDNNDNDNKKKKNNKYNEYNKKIRRGFLNNPDKNDKFIRIYNPSKQNSAKYYIRNTYDPNLKTEFKTTTNKLKDVKSSSSKKNSNFLKQAKLIKDFPFLSPFKHIISKFWNILRFIVEKSLITIGGGLFALISLLTSWFTSKCCCKKYKSIPQNDVI